MEYNTISFKHDRYKDYLDFVHHYSDEPNNEQINLRRRWWCFDNPNGGYFACAYTNSEIVATCYIAGKKITFGDNVLNAFEIGETWTSERHRRRGLFSKLVTLCNELAFNADAVLVYGTPNDQSTPGYQRLGFSIFEDSNSYLLFVADPISLFKNRFCFRGKSLLLDKRPLENRLLIGNKKISELTSDEYISATFSLKRFNLSTHEYLKWRLSDGPAKYRFFSVDTFEGGLLLAIKHGKLGTMRLLVVSEYFFNGRRLFSFNLLTILRNIGRLFYKGYDAIYLRANGFFGITKYLNLLRYGIITHRFLPVCYFSIKHQKFFDNQILDDFQLSDCDIG